MSGPELTEAEVELLPEDEYQAILEQEQTEAEYWAALRAAWRLTADDIAADQAAGGDGIPSI